MSEFVLIAPSDYTLVDVNQVSLLTQYGLGDLKRLEEMQNYGDFTQLMFDNGLMPEGTEGIVSLRLIEDRDLYIKFY